jgi:hypothetical protein
MPVAALEGAGGFLNTRCYCFNKNASLPPALVSPIFKDFSMKKSAILLLLVAAIGWSQIPDELNPYVRKPKKVALGVELGINSLASMAGIKGTYFVTPQVLVDLGLGNSWAGWRPGVYGRYLFSKAKFTPYAYTGFKYALGTGSGTESEAGPDSNTTYHVKIDPSPYFDFGFGLDYLADGGFNFNMALGWSELLGGRKFSYVGAQPSQDYQDGTAFLLGSGLAFSIGFGYAF